MYLRQSRLSRFLVGGMIDPADYLINGSEEWRLDQAIEWQNGLKSAPDRAECVEALDIPEPTPAYETVTDPETGAEEEKETDEHAEWSMKLTFAHRNITYNNRNDRWDRATEVGYIYQVHDRCGLDVVLQIPQISAVFVRSMFGTSDDFWWDYDNERYTYLNSWPDTDVFTEIVIEPTDKFLHLNCSGTFQIPPPDQHYHITLTHTADVGKGYNFDEDLIHEWYDAYERMRLRYHGKKARLGLGRWGGGYTFYISNATKVEGLAATQNLIDDPDVQTVFVVPQKYKGVDGMHISLLF